ncbi:hypothetical protein [Nodularia sp. LEGE 04288]|uniref:hypothetical protein n=1 Tax=Nodularia sp. LEGE 04288 TaxID=1828639 RepID=UPI001D129143|nr:hypothetical protein [Nodularia sp. LEGE 04288]
MIFDERPAVLGIAVINICYFKIPNLNLKMVLEALTSRLTYYSPPVGMSEGGDFRLSPPIGKDFGYFGLI